MDSNELLIPEELMKIIFKQSLSICKIQNNFLNYSDYSFVSGFLCKIPIDKKNTKAFFYTLITIDIAISEKIKENSELKMQFNNDKIYKSINIDKSRLIFEEKKFGITIIEIKENDGFELNHFLEIDNIEKNDNKYIDEYKDKNIYILQYFKDGILCLSKGYINSSDEKENILFYDCLTGSDSMGSPIINETTNKIIGIHKTYFVQNKKIIGFGYLIKKVIIEYINNLISNNNINSNKTLLFKESLGAEKFENQNINHPTNKFFYDNILEEFDNSLDTSLKLDSLVKSNKINYNDIEVIDNFYEDNYDLYNNKLEIKLLLENNEIFLLNNIILKQFMSICKIEITYSKDSTRYGTGFLCKFPHPNKKDYYFYALITAYHILYYYGKNEIKGEVKIIYNNEKCYEIINFEESRYYANKKYDIVIIEINNGFGFNNFLELDDFENDDNEKIKKYNGKEIYQLFFKSKNSHLSQFFSRGFIKRIDINQNMLFYSYLAGAGSSGSPIFNFKTNKVIGIHRGKYSKNRGFDNEENFGIGYFIDISVKEYINNIIINNSLNSLSSLFKFYDYPYMNKSCLYDDFYENKYGSDFLSETIKGFNLSNLSNIPDEPYNFVGDSSGFNSLFNLNNDNYNNIEQIDNSYEGNFDVEAKKIVLKNSKENFIINSSKDNNKK